MKKTFSGFYSPSAIKIKNAWKHEKTLFIFDTNVLLNLYSYTEEARNDFFKILDGITDRIWLPNHVGLEYQRNRLKSIKNEKYIFKKLENYLGNIEKSIDSQEYKELKLTHRLPVIHEKTEELHTNIQSALNNFRNIVEKQNKKQPDVRSGDKIRKKIGESFDNKIGKPFIEQKILDELYKEGKNRYENNIPPGYKDVNKKDDKIFTYGGLNYTPMYGDLIIWKQIIEKSKSSDIKSVVFITDDTKEDWWYIIDSSGEKRIGVRAELREEIEIEAKISLFDVMTTSSFMESGKKYLELDVSKDSIEEVEEKGNSYIDRKQSGSQLQKILERYSAISNNSVFDKNNDISEVLNRAIGSVANEFKNPSVMQELERVQRQQKEKIDALLESYQKPFVDNTMLKEMQRVQNKHKILFEKYKNLGLL